MTSHPFSSSSRVGDVFTGTNRMSHQGREPIGDEEERLAMKRSEMPPPLPNRVPNPRSRDDRALHTCFSYSDNMHRATSDDAYTQAWFGYSRSVFPQSVGKQVQMLSFFTCQRTSVAFSSTKMDSFNRKSEFRKPENLQMPITEVKISMLLNCHFSENFGTTIMLISP